MIMAKTLSIAILNYNLISNPYSALSSPLASASASESKAVRDIKDFEPDTDSDSDPDHLS